MNGRSATSTRRCTPGPRGGSTRSTASAAAPATAPFSKRVFHKLMLNFTWWVNRKDAEGRNIFQGGFLGLDNIGIFDRSAPLPTGGHINQADGTAWMAMYSLNLMRIALVLAEDNHVYEDIATKFFEHFLYIAQAMTNIGGSGIGLWDETDEFYYDVLQLPNGDRVPLKVRSMVGLIPLFAVEVLDGCVFRNMPEFTRRLRWFLDYRPDLAKLVSRWNDPNSEERHLLSLLRGHRMKRLLARMLDESEFLSEYGIRAVSKRHEHEPFVFEHQGSRFSIGYVPGESRTTLFGGNSNWRGPIWMPVNYLLIESLRRFHRYYGDEFKVECPAGSGQYHDLGRGGDGIVAPPVAAVSEGRHRKAAGIRRLAAPPKRSRLSRSRAVSRVFSRRHRPRHRRLAPDRLDRARGAADCGSGARRRGGGGRARNGGRGGVTMADRPATGCPMPIAIEGATTGSVAVRVPSKPATSHAPGSRGRRSAPPARTAAPTSTRATPRAGTSGSLTG